MLYRLYKNRYHSSLLVSIHVHSCTHTHTLTHAQECRRIGVECIVAPYEADAQLAYLEKEGIVDLVITEDSDLLVFGCKRVLFKMDDAGNGKLIDLERDSLGKANKNLIVSPS